MCWIPEIYKGEPYGPGTSSLYLTSPSNMSAAYRLVRMDGTTQFMILMKPGENKTVTFPCGRYTLKIEKGETWISDEEAIGLVVLCLAIFLVPVFLDFCDRFGR